MATPPLQMMLQEIHAGQNENLRGSFDGGRDQKPRRQGCPPEGIRRPTSARTRLQLVPDTLSQVRFGAAKIPITGRTVTMTQRRPFTAAINRNELTATAVCAPRSQPVHRRSICTADQPSCRDRESSHQQRAGGAHELAEPWWQSPEIERARRWSWQGISIHPAQAQTRLAPAEHEASLRPPKGAEISAFVQLMRERQNGTADEQPTFSDGECKSWWRGAASLSTVECVGGGGRNVTHTQSGQPVLQSESPIACEPYDSGEAQVSDSVSGCGGEPVEEGRWNGIESRGHYQVEPAVTERLAAAAAAVSLAPREWGMNCAGALIARVRAAQVSSLVGDALRSIDQAVADECATSEACGSCLRVLEQLVPYLGPLAPLCGQLRAALERCLISPVSQVDLLLRHPILVDEELLERSARRSLLRTTKAVASIQRMRSACGGLSGRLSFGMSGKLSASMSGRLSGCLSDARPAELSAPGLLESENEHVLLPHCVIAKRYETAVAAIEKQLAKLNDHKRVQQEGIAEQEQKVAEAKELLQEKTRSINSLLRQVDTERQAICKQQSTADAQHAKTEELKAELVRFFRDQQERQHSLAEEVAVLKEINKELQRCVTEVREPHVNES